MLANIVEIKETAQRFFLERDCPELVERLDELREQDDAEGQQQSLEQKIQVEQKEEEANKLLRNFMAKLTTCLESIGHVKPTNKVYSLTKDLNQMALVFCLFSLNALQYLVYDTRLYSLVRSRREVQIDGPHFIAGLLTIFKQYHNSHFRRYLMFMTNYVKNVVYAAQFQPNGTRQLPPEVAPVLCFLEEVMRFDGGTRDVIVQITGPFIFDYF